MNIYLTLLLILIIILIISCSWCLSTFIRLKSAEKKYNSDEVFESACHLSKKYVITGFNMSIFIIFISVIVLIILSIISYKTF
jgi:hypothetical protein